MQQHAVSTTTAATGASVIPTSNRREFINVYPIENLWRDCRQCNWRPDRWRHWRFRNAPGTLTILHIQNGYWSLPCNGWHESANGASITACAAAGCRKDFVPETVNAVLCEWTFINDFEILFEFVEVFFLLRLCHWTTPRCVPTDDEGAIIDKMNRESWWVSVQRHCRNRRLSSNRESFQNVMNIFDLRNMFFCEFFLLTKYLLKIELLVLVFFEGDL